MRSYGVLKERCAENNIDNPIALHLSSFALFQNYLEPGLHAYYFHLYLLLFLFWFYTIVSGIVVYF